MSKNNRFTSAGQASKNIIQPPSCVMHYYNVPLCVTEETFTKVGTEWGLCEVFLLLIFTYGVFNIISKSLTVHLLLLILLVFSLLICYLIQFVLWPLYFSGLHPSLVFRCFVAQYFWELELEWGMLSPAFIKFFYHVLKSHPLTELYISLHFPLTAGNASEKNWFFQNTTPHLRYWVKPWSAVRICFSYKSWLYCIALKLYT